MTTNIKHAEGLSPGEKRALLAQLLKKKAGAAKSVHPLSHNQRAMWFLYQLSPESSAYNAAATVRIRSEVDVTALKRTFQALIDRHASLRTTFTIRSDEPVQEVQGYQEVHFEEIDASAWSEEALREQVIALYRRPFDLERGPMLRVHLLTRSVSDHVLLLTVHHVVFDGWSAWLLLDELRTLYAAEISGVKTSLPRLSHQYTDFVDWQANLLAGPEGERLLAYWRQQLAGDLPALNLPTDRLRPPLQTYQGATHVFTLDEELTAKIKDLAKAESATLYMILLAAFQTLLYRYTGQEDILVGSPTSGRSRPEFAGIVGDFINMVVLRANLGGDMSFRTFLSQMRQTVLQALAHQDYPFSLLVEQLAPNRDPSRSPLFQVSFVLQKPQRSEELIDLYGTDKDNSRLNFGGLELQSFVLTQQEGQLDLTLDMTEAKGILLGHLRYNTDLFEAASIARMQQHFQTLLESIIADPEQRLSDLPLLPHAERQQLLVEWNDTALDYPQDQGVHQLVGAQVARTPEAVAVVFENQQLTYRQLNERANQLAHHLRSLGVGPDTLVGIFVERSIEMIVGLLGVLKAGGAYVPLDPAFPRERLAFMLADSQAQVVLTQESLLGDVPLPGDTRIVCLDRDWSLIAQQSTEELFNQAQPNNLAYVIYTSGSTGKPKGVQLQHQGVVNFLTTMRQEIEFTDKDVLLSVTTLSFDIAVLEIFLTLSTGARLVLVSRATAADGTRLLAELAAPEITVMQATPTTWRMLIESGWSRNPGLRVLCGGEALPRDLADQLLERCACLWNVYGPTETTVWSTIFKVRPGEGAVPIGRPIGNTQCYVLDAHGQPAPIGLPGELYIGGDGLARGYLNRPQLTDEKFIPDPFSHRPGARLYRTGDLVRYLPDGNIEFLGRIDHQVKIRGFRVELGEIEAVLVQQPAVREAVVIVREDVPGDKRLVAYLIPNQAEVPTTGELRNFVREKLPDYMVPSAFIFLDAYPLTPNKKVDRKALPVPDQTRPELDSQFAPPRTPLESLIAEVWQEVLGVDRVGVYDNFFDLGGHSLLSVQAMARLEQKTGLKVPLALVGYQTLGQLAATYEAQMRLVQSPEAPGSAQASSDGGDVEPRKPSRAGLEPFYFGVPGKRLFGCYHAPHSGPARDCAIALCYPQGEEYIRSHRAYHQLATRLARAGFPVLRFDFLGCGDSEGETEEGGLSQWLSDVAAAVGELKERSGLRQVCLVGLRLGASLALLSSAEREDVTGVVLWEPITNGKAYLAELRAQHQETLWHFPVRLKDSGVAEHPKELMGFPLTATMLADFESLDCLTIQPNMAKHVLIVEGQEEGVAGTLREHLHSNDAQVAYRFIPSFKIWTENPDKGLVPHQALQGIVSWISEVYS